MGVIWTILAVAVGIYLFYAGARWVAGGRQRAELGGRSGDEDLDSERFPRVDRGANINPSQLGNEVDLWPDRTGARTRRELGARHAADVSFVGDREEHKQGAGAQQPVQAQARPSAPGVRREVQPSMQTGGPGSPTGNALAPEAEFGEDRPAARTTAPDQPPTQWHPRDHGAPGDHYREGHHRSATAPERKSDATDPFAHAPVPGPNHLPPETGDRIPPEARS